ncbi:hypothetical protein BpHYR1_019151 [Brachionus plicatilis]|uniref:Uncharacterized protein n=1 Tax=Brachionus plicatilis TaxID=10195 RepID=A0A3M7PSM4_BRAPC|nr:hypothetical protein BpHYR1_019151 [Brachionus plicatilis]
MGTEILNANKSNLFNISACSLNRKQSEKMIVPGKNLSYIRLESIVHKIFEPMFTLSTRAIIILND